MNSFYRILPPLKRSTSTCGRTRGPLGPQVILSPALVPQRALPQLDNISDPKIIRQTRRHFFIIFMMYGLLRIIFFKVFEQQIWHLVDLERYQFYHL